MCGITACGCCRERFGALCAELQQGDQPGIGGPRRKDRNFDTESTPLVRRMMTIFNACILISGVELTYPHLSASLANTVSKHLTRLITSATIVSNFFKLFTIVDRGRKFLCALTRQ